MDFSLKKHTTLFLTAVLLAAFGSSAMARPVSYAGGWMAMSMNDGENNSVEVNYSPTSSYSVGYGADYWRSDEFTLHSGRVNWLAQRWNGPDHQANFYLMGGFGAAVGDLGAVEDETEPAGYAGLEFDAEDRRYYVSYENRWTDAGDFGEFFSQKGRVGFAPYVAEYGSLHTWIMLQVDHKPWAEDELVWTPLLRFFKGDMMLEVGLSDSEEVLFNLTWQF